MSTIDQAGKSNQGEIRYLTPLDIATKNKKKYCRFKRSGIKYIDYKDPDFLLKFINEQGKILPKFEINLVVWINIDNYFNGFKFRYSSHAFNTF